MTSTHPEPGRVTSGVLAVIVHVLFVVMLVFGIRWQQRMPEPMVVELWRDIPTSKPEPVAKPVEPTPPPPAPKPEPKAPEPPKAVVQPKPAPPVPSKAEIDLKEEKQRKLREQKQAEEERRQEVLRNREEARKEAEARQREEQLRQEEQKKQEAARHREEEKRLEEARRAEELRMEKEAEARRVAILDEQQKLAQEVKVRAEEDARKRALAEAAAAQAKALEGYKRKISQKIRSYVPSEIKGNFEAVYSVTLLPGGEVLDVKLVKSSGVPAYDAAVERAIHAAAPLPVPPPDSDLFQKLREANYKFRPVE
jgi:colicin import membrane protein